MNGRNRRRRTISFHEGITAVGRGVSDVIESRSVCGAEFVDGQTFVPPKAVSVSDGSGTTLSVDLIAVESLGVSCEELRLDIPALGAANLDTLKKWANDLCRRVTYLLENLGPLEFDARGNEVLIRSTPPDQSTVGKSNYYEVMLSSQGSGRFSLRRFHYDSSTASRVPVPLKLTHEQLFKLVNDLVATTPSTP